MTASPVPSGNQSDKSEDRKTAMKIDVFNHVFPPALFAELGRYLPAAPLAPAASVIPAMAASCAAPTGPW